MTTRKITARKSVTVLYRKFERTHSAFKAIPYPPRDERLWDRALDRCCTAAQLVVDARAETIDELLLKSRAIVWTVDSVKIEDVAAWAKSQRFKDAEHRGLASLGKDLTRIAKRL